LLYVCIFGAPNLWQEVKKKIKTTSNKIKDCILNKKDFVKTGS